MLPSQGLFVPNLLDDGSVVTGDRLQREEP
jgi:hypothetical protein